MSADPFRIPRSFEDRPCEQPTIGNGDSMIFTETVTLHPDGSATREINPDVWVMRADDALERYPDANLQNEKDPPPG